MVMNSFSFYIIGTLIFNSRLFVLPRRKSYSGFHALDYTFVYADNIKIKHNQVKVSGICLNRMRTFVQAEKMESVPGKKSQANFGVDICLCNGYNEGRNPLSAAAFMCTGGHLSMTNREKRIENLQRSNEESHRLIVESLRQALYTMLKTRDIDSIKVVDLVKAAGVSRGGFYRNFYLVTDVLKDDIRVIADDVRRVSGADVGANWQIILNTVYQHREKIPLLLKAGMGMEILRQINRSIDGVSEEFKLRLIAWNGVIFNCILWWADRDFADAPEELGKQLTEITEPLLDANYIASSNTGTKPKR